MWLWVTLKRITKRGYLTNFLFKSLARQYSSVVYLWWKTLFLLIILPHYPKLVLNLAACSSFETLNWIIFWVIGRLWSRHLLFQVLKFYELRTLENLSSSTRVSQLLCIFLEFLTLFPGTPKTFQLFSNVDLRCWLPSALNSHRKIFTSAYSPNFVV